MIKHVQNIETTIYKETSSLGRLLIKQVSKDLARELILANHYSHKWNNAGFGKYNFGIFRTDEPDKCLGVAVYGYMKSPRAKIFKHPAPNAWMCELNRLWIDDTLGHNAETILIAASIKLLRRIDTNIVAIQSFADGRLGCGTIYKAANFKYYGVHFTRFLRHKKTGEVTHEQMATNTDNLSGYLRANICFLIGDFEVMRVKTYRYIYPLCKHFIFIKKEQSYPEYEKGFEMVEWKRDRQKIKSNIILLLDKIAA